MHFCFFSFASRLPRHVSAAVWLSRLSQTDGTVSPVCQTQTGQADWPFSLSHLARLSRHVLGRPGLGAVVIHPKALNSKTKTNITLILTNIVQDAVTGPDSNPRIHNMGTPQKGKYGAGLLILQYFLYCNTIGNTFSSIASILAILFQKNIANGIANTFVPKILPILFGNTFILLDAMIIVKHFNNRQRSDTTDN